MVLIAASLSLLIIYMGTKLLIKVKKEMLGSFFKFISWFIITGGFVLLLCSIFLLCKRNCGNYRHPGFNESAAAEVCDHTCVKKPFVDSVDLQTKNASTSNSETKGSYLCKYCDENSVQSSWCCKKESACDEKRALYSPDCVH
jgi:hypothetical protein